MEYPDLAELLEIYKRASLNIERLGDDDHFEAIIKQIARERDAIVQLAIENGIADQLAQKL